MPRYSALTRHHRSLRWRQSHLASDLRFITYGEQPCLLPSPQLIPGRFTRRKRQAPVAPKPDLAAGESPPEPSPFDVSDYGGAPMSQPGWSYPVSATSQLAAGAPFVTVASSSQYSTTAPGGQLPHSLPSKTRPAASASASDTVQEIDAGRVQSGPRLVIPPPYDARFSE